VGDVCWQGCSKVWRERKAARRVLGIIMRKDFFKIRSLWIVGAKEWIDIGGIEGVGDAFIFATSPPGRSCR
jgi:hypothetical protein